MINEEHMIIWSYHQNRHSYDISQDHLIKSQNDIQQQSPKHQPPNVGVYDSYRNKTHPSKDLILPNKILRIWRANNIWAKLQNAPCPLTIAVSKVGGRAQQGLNHWIQHPLAKPEYHGRIVCFWRFMNDWFYWDQLVGKYTNLIDGMGYKTPIPGLF